MRSVFCQAVAKRGGECLSFPIMLMLCISGCKKHELEQNKLNAFGRLNECKWTCKVGSMRKRGVWEEPRDRGLFAASSLQNTDNARTVKGEEAHPPQWQASESTDDRNVASWQKLPVYNISAARELPFYVISFKSGFRVCTHAEPTNLRRVIRYETIISITSLKSHSQETFFDVM